MSDSTIDTAMIRIRANGPYLVSGNLRLHELAIETDAGGDSVGWIAGNEFPATDKYALCRCGHSANKPFCDSTHRTIGFDGTETANRATHAEQAKRIVGPTMTLADAESLCAFARYCDPNGKVWNQVRISDQPEARANFVRQSCECPSGRLVASDNATGQPIEKHYDPSIAVLADPAQKCLGPLWVRGGVQLVGADGFKYEVRNRMTLCRCGASKNKPFCDGAHASIGFNADS